MAGEWLKFDAATPEKPEVFAMTAALGWDDPDLTVGKLLRVWRWFDQQTIDGNAPNVTLALLDRIAGVSGFAKAMCDVGWLMAEPTGLHLPHFDRHNGKTAKDRALTAKRVANHKANAEGNAKGNAPIVSDALPREEKRREEKKVSSKAETQRASRLPADWVPTYEDEQFCKTERPDLIVMDVAAQFCDYWHAIGGSKGCKLDWSATWRNWVRSQKAGKQSRPNGNSQLGVAGQATAAAAAQWLEGANAG